MDEGERNALLVRIMGGPDALQVDGIGGGHPLTSKVAVIRSSADSEIDVDYLFLQVDPHNQIVSSAQNCGNLLAGVGIFAIEEGLVEAQQSETRVRVRMLNSDAVCYLDLQTPGGETATRGDTSIDGVPGTSPPIVCNYIDIAGSSCGALLPTGHAADLIGGIEVTCVDNGMPVVVLRAVDCGLSGVESPEELDRNDGLKQQLERIRIEAGGAMNLGDVQDKSIPKMCLVSAALSGGVIMTRNLYPACVPQVDWGSGCGECRNGVPGARFTRGSVGEGTDGRRKRMQVEHPGGSLEVQLELDDTGIVVSAGVVRTARLLFSGEVMV